MPHNLFPPTEMVVRILPGIRLDYILPVKKVFIVFYFFFFFCSGLPDLMVHPGLDEALNNYITCQFLPPFLQILQYICQAVHHFKALADDCYTENSSFNVIIFLLASFWSCCNSLPFSPWVCNVCMAPWRDLSGCVTTSEGSSFQSHWYHYQLEVLSSKGLEIQQL